MTRSFAPALAISAALALSACAVPGGGPRSTTQDPNANARSGAIAGAISGAVVGGAIDNGGEGGILAGAILGGVGGGLAGARLDRQEADLRAALGDGRIGIIRNGNELIVRLPQDVLFATNSANLTGSLRSDLNVLAANIVQYPQTVVTVVGHADNTGGAAFNQDLSERRAAAVQQALVAGGVPGGRIRAIGRGEDQPIASNLTVEGRAQNRRVDIVIRPTN